MYYRNYTNLQSLIKKNIVLLQSGKFDIIVGIPRSGMVPAYMIALYLNKNCCDLDAFVQNRPLKTGITRTPKDDLKYPHDAKKILVVDDCIASGRSLSLALENVPQPERNKIVTLAIYSSEKKRDDVDIFFESLPGPRLFEWNIFHSSIVKRACFTLDGVICNSSSEMVIGSQHGTDLMMNSDPAIVPSGKIGCIVSDRPEKYREITEKWLKKHGIEYEALMMNKNGNKSSVHFKAELYKKSGQELFFERDRKKALAIFKLTKKPVYCVGTNEMFSKGVIVSAFYGSKLSKKFLIENMKNQIRKLYS